MSPGTHKSINYNASESQQRSTLALSWISKSSAIQRAGRTGRLAPGTVYRLYTEQLYHAFVDHSEAEIYAKPLHETVLSMKTIFDEHEEMEYYNFNSGKSSQTTRM
jgi:HrpA-like RNA helicase